MVKEPTQGDYLLDLLLTDVDGVRCKVLLRIADHKLLFYIAAASAEDGSSYKGRVAIRQGRLRGTPE